MLLSGITVLANNICMDEQEQYLDYSHTFDACWENDVITEADYESGFVHYASDSSTVKYVDEVKSMELANVVGVVKDYSTDNLLPNVAICLNGKETLTTDDSGRFQIKNVPLGKYNWSVKASGYCDAFYMNYGVDPLDGTTIFTFYVDKDKRIYKNRDEIEEAAQHLEMEPEPDLVNIGNVFVSASTNAMSSYPSVSNSVRVYYNGASINVDRQRYIYTVLSSELYGYSFYSNLGLSGTQIKQLYVAQATAANTFAEYSLKVYSNHSGSNYDVCSGECCQVYDPTKVTPAALDATPVIFYYAGSSYRNNNKM